MTRIFLIAGEASGDSLGAGLIKSLNAEQPEVELCGVGGIRMAEEGVPSLFPIQDIAYIGFVEILPHLGLIFKRIRQTVKAIEAFRPDVIVTIDAPGFAKQVVKRLQHLRPNTRFIHYVAPSVWAYRPERAERLASLYDTVLCLLPIEPPYFEKAGMEAHFVGHPVVADFQPGDGAAFRQRHGIVPDVPLLGLFPGSRKGEIQRHWPIFMETVQRLRQDHPALQPVVLAAPEVAHLLPPSEGLITITDRSEKGDLLAALNLALVKSGTVPLEVALAKVPMVVTYKVNPISAYLMRRMIHVRFVNLINLLAGREIIPELLQEFCRADLLSQELGRLWALLRAGTVPQLDVMTELKKLTPPNESTSHQMRTILLGGERN